MLNTLSLLGFHASHFDVNSIDGVHTWTMACDVNKPHRRSSSQNVAFDSAEDACGSTITDNIVRHASSLKFVHRLKRGCNSSSRRVFTDKPALNERENFALGSDKPTDQRAKQKFQKANLRDRPNSLAAASHRLLQQRQPI